MKIRKILSLALALLFVLTVFVLPAMAGTKEIKTDDFANPRAEGAIVNGVLPESVLGGYPTQTCIYAGNIGAEGTLKNEWFVDGFKMEITYSAEIPADDGNMNKPMSFRLHIDEPDEVGYANEMPVYPDVYNSSYAVKDNGNGTYTFTVTYADLKGAFDDGSRNKYAGTYSFEEVLSQSTLYTIYTRNGAFNYKIEKIEVSSPAISGGGAATTPPAGGAKNPPTGDSSLLIFAVLALTASASAIFFLKKRVKA